MPGGRGEGTETVISSNGSSTDITTILNKHYRSEKKKKGKSNLAGKYPWQRETFVDAFSKLKRVS